MASKFFRSAESTPCRVGLAGASGFTLIEVLIALLVLAIGLVGIASLHLAGMRNAHSSYYTSIASSIALDFEERLWLEMGDVSDGCLPNARVNAVVAELAGDWGAQEGGNVAIPLTNIINHEIRLDGTDGGPFWMEVQISIEWSDERFGGNGNGTERFPYTARLICAPEDESTEEETNG